ncbi:MULTISPECIES: DUF1996 domain-containing protein [unclassified Streptomyces]|uniref:DUF1996 domain-containing protein n=1 Tax=unclassified Streptomyces TaxID=2593676 RepID=UPI002E2C2E9C|nr:DUF1996 domain-containing protein [Streptomyces sp. NBC_00228]
MAAVALMLGGGGLVAANVYASASEGWGGDTTQQGSPDAASDGATIDCPDIGTQLTTVPDAAKTEVDNQLALLDQQITEAYQKLKDSTESIRQDASFADNAIMNPLKEKRAATIGRIDDAIARVGDRPEGLDALAGCTLIAPTNGSDDQSGDDKGNGDASGDATGSGDASASAGGQDQQGNQPSTNGPVASDYADITSVQPNVNAAQDQADASRGTFVTACGVNENGLFNSDNVIVAPGVTNGAHHFHDYVGNQSNNAFASDDDLAKANTSCENQGDKSTYYWPVLRLQNGKQERDADKPGGGTEGNSGQIVTAKAATLTFVGNPKSKVVAMPRLLRIITGDAKAFVNGPANANASWSCTGFEDRQLKDKYPLCPSGSDVVRTFKFQSCWDGRNIDSANHRTHVAFEAADGTCPAGFEAIPQLVQRIVYDVKAPSLQDGGKTTPLFAVDSFPEQQHKPVTDHGDFINVFDEGLMKDMVNCINNGEKCGAGTDNDPGGSGDGSGSGGGSGNAGGSGNGGGSGSGEPQESPTATDSAQPTAGATASDEPAGNGGNQGNGGNAGGGDNGGNAGSGDNGGNGGKGDNGGQATADPATSAPDDQPTDVQTTDPGSLTTAVSVPKADTKTEGSKSTPAQGGSDDNAASGGEVGTAETTPPASSSGGESYAAVSPNEPQAQGGLAETGANLWPAVAGALLLVAGFVVLYRSKRSSR